MRDGCRHDNAPDKPVEFVVFSRGIPVNSKAGQKSDFGFQHFSVVVLTFKGEV